MDSVSITAGNVVALTYAPTPAPTIASTTAPIQTLAPVAPPIGEDLVLPPDLRWKLDADTGVHTGEVEFGVVTVKNFWGQTTTRGFDGGVRVSKIFPKAAMIFLLDTRIFLGVKISRTTSSNVI